MRFHFNFWIIGVLILVSVLINLFGFMQGIDWGDDFAGYVIQAQTLSSGDFHTLQENMSRNDFILNYPWGFPTLITPVIRYFNSDILILKKYVFVFFIASLFIIYFLFKEEKIYSLLSMLLISSSTYFWYFKNYLFSDLPNLFFTLCALLFIKHVVISGKKLLNPHADNILIGVFIFMSFWIRTQSVILLLTLFIVQIFYLKKELFKYRTFLVNSLPYLAFLLLRFITSTLIPVKAVSYLDVYKNSSFTETISQNVFYYINIWKELFHEAYWLQEVEGAATGIFLFLFCVGISARWKENLLYFVYFFGVLGIVLISPFYQGIRYLVPALPILFYFFVKGIFHVANSISLRRGKIIGYSLFGLYAYPQLYTITSLSYLTTTSHYQMDGPYTSTAVQLFHFLKQSTNEKSLVGYWKPRAMLLYSQRNARLATSYAECLEKNIDYYVHFNRADVDRIPLEALLSDSLHFSRVFENKDFKVFKVLNNSMYNAPKDLKITSANVGELVTTLNFEYFDPSVIFEKEKLIALWSNSPVKSKAFPLEKGSYIFSVYSKGTGVKGEFPVNTISVNDRPLGRFTAVEQPGRKDFIFEMQENKEITISLKMENDLQAEKEDRNTFVYCINVYKKK